MSAADVERVVQIVLADPTLQRRLLALPERREFVPAVVAVAGEHGIAITDDDVVDGLRAARRAWLERWV